MTDIWQHCKKGGYHIALEKQKCPHDVEIQAKKAQCIAYILLF